MIVPYDLLPLAACSLCVTWLISSLGLGEKADVVNQCPWGALRHREINLTGSQGCRCAIRREEMTEGGGGVVWEESACFCVRYAGIGIPSLPRTCSLIGCKLRTVSECHVFQLCETEE